MSDKIPTTREITIILGKPPSICNPLAVRILPCETPFAKRRCSRNLAELITALVERWHVEIIIEAYGKDVETILETVPLIPKTGVKQIHLFRACVGSVGTFLRLDGLGKDTPKIINHLEMSVTKRLVDRLAADTFGPADRPLSTGYLFKHSFWQDVPT